MALYYEDDIYMWNGHDVSHIEDKVHTLNNGQLEYINDDGKLYIFSTNTQILTHFDYDLTNVYKMMVSKYFYVFVEPDKVIQVASFYHDTQEFDTPDIQEFDIPDTREIEIIDINPSGVLYKRNGKFYKNLELVEVSPNTITRWTFGRYIYSYDGKRVNSEKYNCDIRVYKVDDFVVIDLDLLYHVIIHPSGEISKIIGVFPISITYIESNDKILLIKGYNKYLVTRNSIFFANLGEKIQHPCSLFRQRKIKSARNI